MPAVAGGFFQPIVSNDLLDIFKAFNCGSMRSFPIRVFNKNDSDRVFTDSYVGVALATDCEPEHLDKGIGKLFRRDLLQKTGYDDAFGLYFDHSSWSGLDVFRLSVQNSIIIVTKDVVEAIERASLQGYRICDVLDYKKDVWERMKPKSK